LTGRFPGCYTEPTKRRPVRKRMRIASSAVALALVLGCTSRAPAPMVLQEAELRERIVVPHAGPIDPESVLFTLRQDGRVSGKGRIQTADEMAARTSAVSDKINQRPILFEVDPRAGFSVVRDALGILTGRKCVNFAFLVDTPRGPGAVVLPMLADKCTG